MPLSKTDQVIQCELPILPAPESKDNNLKALGPVHRARALPSRSLAPAALLWQYQIDLARAQAFIFRFLAKAFSFPKPDDWRWLSNPTIHTIFCAAVRHLVPPETAPLRNLAGPLLQQFHPGQFETFLDELMSFFNSSESTQLGSGLIFPDDRSTCSESQEFSFLESLLKDFDLEISEWPGKPSDLLCVGLEFMSWLLTREAELLEQRDEDQANLYRNAQKKLLRNFLAARAAQLSPSTSGLLAKLVLFLQQFVQLQYHWAPRTETSLEHRHSPSVRATLP